MKDVQRDILDKITPDIKKEMEGIWFTADLHAMHPKVVNICDRPVKVDPDDVKNAGVKVTDVSDPAWKRLIGSQALWFIPCRL